MAYRLFLRTLVAFVLALLAVPLAAPGSALAEDITIQGTMTDPEGEPIEGVRFTVRNDEGFTGEATSAADGTWQVVVPGAGTYRVEIDSGSLPDGVTLRDPERTELTVNVLSRSRTVSFPVGEGGGSGSGTASRAVQLFADGLVFGLIIACAGVGLSLIFGTTGLTNFAHGDLMTLGALATLVCNNILGLPFLPSAAVALLVAASFGWLQDRGLWRPLRARGTSLVALLVVSIGFGILIRYVFLFFFGGSTTPYREFSGQAGWVLGPVSITPKSLVASLVAIVALLLTIGWLLFTRMGKASRAISDNPALASASGIDVEKVISRVWIIGSSLAALGGIIYALNNGVNWIFGFQLLLLVFAGVVLGGLGTAFGALVGSLVVGVLIQMSTLVVPPELKNVGALVILILILLFRPQGILGRAERIG